MPRPTPAQLAYGLATVVFSTFAMLLLSQTRSGIGVAVITVAGLALGLLVAITVPLPRAQRGSRTARAARTPQAPPATASRVPAQGAHAPAHARAGAESLGTRVGEHSLHG